MQLLTTLRLLQMGMAPMLARKVLRIKPKLPKVPKFEGEVVPAFTSLDEHVCFACSDKSHHGLKLKFHDTDKGGLACKWSATGEYQNYPGMIHGGVSFTILDELLGQVIFHESGFLPVSIQTATEWYRPVKLGDEITAWAHIDNQAGQFFKAKGYIFTPDGKVAVKVESLFFTPSEKHFSKLTGIKEFPKVAKSWFFRQ